MSMYGSSNAFGKDMWLDLEDSFNYQFASARGKFWTLVNNDGRDPGDIPLQGRRYYVKLKIGDSVGGASISEGGDWATPGDPTWAEASVTLSNENHVIEFTRHEAELLRSNAAAARDVLPEKMDSALEHQMRRCERQMWMDGTGKQANIASSSGSTVTLDEVDSDNIDRNRFTWVDDPNRARYDIVHTTTGAQQVTAFTVTGIVESTDVLTCSTTMTAADSSGVLVASGNWASGGAFRSLEFPGVQASLNNTTGTYLGIDVSLTGNEYFRSNVISNSGTLRNLNTTLIRQLRNKVMRRSVMKQAPIASNGYYWFANDGVWAAAHELMSPGLRYTTADTPDIGWENFDLYGAPCLLDPSAPRCRLLLLKPDSFHMLYAQYRKGSIFSWNTTGDGNSWFQKTAASGAGYADAAQRSMGGLIGMYTERPRNHGLLDDITEVGPSWAV